MPTRTSAKQQPKLNKSLLKDLPYFNFRGNLVLAHGQFNNSLNSELPTKRDLDKLRSLYDLDLFKVSAPANFQHFILSLKVYPH